MLILLLLAVVSASTNISVCLQSAIGGSYCYPLLIANGLSVGRACVDLLTSANGLCCECSSCPCTQFAISVQTYNSTSSYVDYSASWMGLNPDEIPIGDDGLPIVSKYPYRCQNTVNKSYCITYVPFKYIYGNYSVKNLCNSYIYVSIYGRLRINDYSNITAWAQGYEFVDGQQPTYNYTIARCGKMCPHGCGPRPTPTPTPSPTDTPTPEPTPTPSPEPTPTPTPTPTTCLNIIGYYSGNSTCFADIPSLNTTTPGWLMTLTVDSISDVLYIADNSCNASAQAFYGEFFYSIGTGLLALNTNIDNYHVANYSLST